MSVPAVDWDKVRCAPLEEVAAAIQCRGMHWNLANSIQRLLEIVLAEEERRDGLSLERLRASDADTARKYLQALPGIGSKSAACIVLLTLMRADFPIDVNVGRIAARLVRISRTGLTGRPGYFSRPLLTIFPLSDLTRFAPPLPGRLAPTFRQGWVPLEAAQALEDLEEYAPEPAVYSFLKERLLSLGHGVLYELHYAMISLGKTFCSKRSPHCSACPAARVCEYAKNGGVRRKDGGGGSSAAAAGAAKAAAGATAAGTAAAAEGVAAAPAGAAAANGERSSQGAPPTACGRAPPPAAEAGSPVSVLDAAAALESHPHSASPPEADGSADGSVDGSALPSSGPATGTSAQALAVATQEERSAEVDRILSVPKPPQQATAAAAAAADDAAALASDPIAAAAAAEAAAAAAAAGQLVEEETLEGSALDLKVRESSFLRIPH